MLIDGCRERFALGGADGPELIDVFQFAVHRLHREVMLRPVQFALRAEAGSAHQSGFDAADRGFRDFHQHRQFALRDMVFLAQAAQALTPLRPGGVFLTRPHLGLLSYKLEPDSQMKSKTKSKAAPPTSAKLWMIEHQLGQRNLNDAQDGYYRGLHEQLEKKRVGRPEGNGSKMNPFRRTVESVAAQHKVSVSTIKRDSKFARAVDAIADAAGNGVWLGRTSCT
jgi:hypothetical protein